MEVCCTRSNCEGFKDVLYIQCTGMLWNGNEEDDNARRECEEDEGIDCEDGDCDTDW